MLFESLEGRLGRPVLIGEYPTKADLENNRVTVDSIVLQRVQSKLGNLRHCVISGGEGQGKTALARYVGFKLMVGKQRVFHIDLCEPGGWTDDEIGLFIREKDAQDFLYIIENVHDLGGGTRLQLLLDSTLRSLHSRFIYTERVAGEEGSFDKLDLAIGGRAVRREELVVRLKPTAELVQSVIKRYVATATRPLVEPSPSDCQAIVKKCASNLRILSAYLAAWEQGDFSTIPENRMLEGVYQGRLAALDPHLREAYVRMSGVLQFGVPGWGAVFGTAQMESLAHCRLLGSLDRPGYFVLAHPTDGALNVRAWAAANALDPERFTRDTLKHYLTFSPEPENVGLLLHRLSGRWKSLLGSLLGEDPIQRAFIDVYERSVEVAPLSYIRRLIGITSDLPALKQELLQRLIKRGGEFVATKIREADEEDVAWVRRQLKQNDEDSYRAVDRLLTRQDWQNIWLRLPLPRLVRFLYPYADEPHVHEHTQLAAETIDRLIQTDDFEDRLQRLSYELVGKLVLVGRRVGASCIAALAEKVAATVILETCQEPVALTLILKELWESGNKSAFRSFLKRVSDEVAVTVFKEEKTGRGVAYLLLSLSHDPDTAGTNRGMAVVDQALGNDIVQRLQTWDPSVVATLLWSIMLLNESRAMQIARELNVGSVAEILSRAKCDEAFRILWNLRQIDLNKFSEVVASGARRLSEKCRQAGRPIEPNCLPLLGLLLGMGAWPNAPQLPDPEAAALLLAEKPDPSALIFALRCYQALSQERARTFLKAVQTVLTKRGEDSPLEFLCYHPKHAVAAAFRETVRQVRSSGPHGSESVRPNRKG